MSKGEKVPPNETKKDLVIHALNFSEYLQKKSETIQNKDFKDLLQVQSSTWKSFANELLT